MEILSKINDQRALIKRRSDGFARNPRDEKLGDPANLGHQKAFQEAQRGLRNALEDWYGSGCGDGRFGDIPSDSWDLATRPTPAPNQDPNRQRYASDSWFGRLLDRVQDWIDDVLGGGCPGPACTK